MALGLAPGPPSPGRLSAARVRHRLRLCGGGALDGIRAAARAACARDGSPAPGGDRAGDGIRTWRARVAGGRGPVRAALAPRRPRRYLGGGTAPHHLDFGRSCSTGPPGDSSAGSSPPTRPPSRPSRFGSSPAGRVRRRTRRPPWSLSSSRVHSSASSVPRQDREPGCVRWSARRMPRSSGWWRTSSRTGR